MTFALYYYDKNSSIAMNYPTKSISLALGYVMEVAVGSEDIIRMAESDSTEECGSGNLTRSPGV